MTSQQMYTIFSVAILRKFNTTQELTPGKWTGLHQLQTGPLPFKKNTTNLKRKKKHSLHISIHLFPGGGFV